MEWLTTWLISISGSAVTVAIVGFLGKTWVDKTLTLLIARDTETLKQHNQSAIEAQKARHATALEEFRQENQRAAEQRSRDFQRYLENIRRDHQLGMEGARHEYSRSLEAARARIQREEQWFARQLDALVHLNEIVISLIPAPDDPYPSWPDVVEHIEKNATEFRNKVHSYRASFEIFLPIEVKKLVRTAQADLDFCHFPPTPDSNRNATGNDVWERLKEARDALQHHIDSQRIAERPSPTTLANEPPETPA